MGVVALGGVIAFSLALVAFAVVTFAKPAVAERFLNGFASSARAHYSEQIIRVLVGAAMIVRSPLAWHPVVFELVGWAIVISSAVLLCLPWRWHQRLGTRLLPFVVRYKRLYAAGAFASGAMLLYAFAG